MTSTWPGVKQDRWGWDGADGSRDAERRRTGRQSRWRRVLLLAVAAAGLIGGGWKLWEHRRYRRAMVEIKQEIQAGRHGHAARKLETLLAWKPDSDEAVYLLGVCEKARGRTQDAFGAWERVSPASPFSARAIQGRMELLDRAGPARRCRDVDHPVDVRSSRGQIKTGPVSGAGLFDARPRRGTGAA